MKPKFSLVALLLCAGSLPGQSRARDLAAILERALETPDVVSFQLRQNLFKKITPLPAPRTAAEWTKEADRIRKHLLDDVVFHGWPKAWIDSAPVFEDQGFIETGQGYRMRKLRYQIVPGFESTAILYEPLNPPAKTPATLNVNGHEYRTGKAAEYKQKRCINFAKNGIYALSLEWLACGELNDPENKHSYAAHLDLSGFNGVGLFYLAMRRGLDYLYQHPNIDRSRLGVTGLSGGGWQTIMLSSLDPRVAVAVPVAGYSAFVSKLEREGDYGDNEQIPQDFLDGQDYSHLTALRAPRPTLVIHNAEDDCCFRAPLVKPYIFDAVKPFFALYGKDAAFGWHENTDPSTHNYQLDNRRQAYAFFSKHFGLPPVADEIPVAEEVRSYDELAVGLPKSNLTILGLARKLVGGIDHNPIPESAEGRAAWATAERGKLNRLVRYKPVEIEHAWALWNTNNRGVETRSYQFLFGNGLSATGVWAKAIASEYTSPATIVLNDKGKKAASNEVSDSIDRGRQVLAADLIFTGDAAPKARDLNEFPLMLATTGDRALGVEAAQLIALARWLVKGRDNRKVRLETSGIRNQVVGLIAAALQPALFSDVIVRDGMPSLRHLVDAPVTFESAPDLFCLDLYKEFDLDRLAAMAAPARVTQKYLGAQAK